MRVFKSLVMVFCLGVLVLSVPPVAKADEWNKETIMTFNPSALVRSDPPLLAKTDPLARKLN